MENEKRYSSEKGKGNRKFRRKDQKPGVADLLDRQPPYSQDAEIGVLGSMMLQPSNIDDVATTLRAGDFYFEANQLLYSHLQDMRNSGKSIDITLLVERLKDKDDYERVGGAAYICLLYTSPSPRDRQKSRMPSSA